MPEPVYDMAHVSLSGRVKMPETLQQLEDGPRSVVWYVINGDGLWASRLQSTHYDWVLMVVTIVGTLWMLWGHVQHCGRLLQAEELATSGAQKDYLLKTHRLLVVSGVLHGLVGIVLWFAPVHYVMAAFIWISAMSMHSFSRVSPAVIAGNVVDRACRIHASESALAESDVEPDSTGRGDCEGTQAIRKLSHNLRTVQAPELRQTMGGVPE